MRSEWQNIQVQEYTVVDRSNDKRWDFPVTEDGFNEAHELVDKLRKEQPIADIELVAVLPTT